MNNFTVEEVEIIKESWKIPAANPHDSAELIFYTFLERYPQYQQVFPSFRTKLLSELKGTPRFRAHSSRIFNAFSSVVDSLEADSENAEVKLSIAELGIAHAKRKVPRKAHEDLRVVLTEILSSVCQLDDDGLVAWSKLLDLVFGVFYECIDGNIDQFM